MLGQLFNYPGYKTCLWAQGRWKRIWSSVCRQSSCCYSLVYIIPSKCHKDHGAVVFYKTTAPPPAPLAPSPPPCNALLPQSPWIWWTQLSTAWSTLIPPIVSPSLRGSNTKVFQFAPHLAEEKFSTYMFLSKVSLNIVLKSWHLFLVWLWIHLKAISPIKAILEKMVTKKRSMFVWPKFKVLSRCHDFLSAWFDLASNHKPSGCPGNFCFYNNLPGLLDCEDFPTWLELSVTIMPPEHHSD